MLANYRPVDASPSLEADLLRPSDSAAVSVPAVPHQGCIHQLIEAQAGRTPKAPAVICGSQVLTYGELNARANQLSRFLVGMGVRAEDRVGIALPSSLNLPIALLGVLKAGGACLPLDPNYPKARLDLMLEDAQPAVVLREQNLATGFSARAPKMLCLDSDGPKIFRGDVADVNRPFRSDGVPYAIYTS